MNQFCRRVALASAILVAGFSHVAKAQQVAAADIFRVTLLGTGAPDPSPDRFSASTLIEAGTHKILIDAGRGASIRLTQLHIPLGSIEVLFLTHYHSDHTIGIPDLWLTGWLPPPFGQRKSPFRVIGPVGAVELMSNLERAYAPTVPSVTTDDIVAQTRETYKGPLVVGEDLMAFEIGADGVAVYRRGAR